ncbi:response regulator [Pseudoalteromonas ardens]|uniref:Chemotaxis protein CheY n=1 Tax=Pseudoalteromonas rubra TaxID=43658 RepID=A0A0L0EQ20_9GAMM|nr:response regulator [Pseudoalteromonas sp. R96]KNC65993.1 chemotaxis protein CheY [Pseudoalteromonas rubra]MDK1310158.1 response regulator [Pseudoalteromonas sp. R96]
MKILVVDDMASMRHVMIGMLRRLGYTDIDEATDGKRALELLEAKPYQLVISDLNMPHIDGLALLHEIRTRPALKNLKLVMVTCENGRERVQQVLLEKVDGFIIKPFSMATLEKQFKKLHLLELIE